MKAARKILLVVLVDGRIAWCALSPSGLIGEKSSREESERGYHFQYVAWSGDTFRKGDKLISTGRLQKISGCCASAPSKRLLDIKHAAFIGACFKWEFDRHAKCTQKGAANQLQRRRIWPNLQLQHVSQDENLSLYSVAEVADSK